LFQFNDYDDDMIYDDLCDDIWMYNQTPGPFNPNKTWTLFKKNKQKKRLFDYISFLEYRMFVVQLTRVNSSNSICYDWNSRQM